MLSNYPNLLKLIDLLDSHLHERHSEFFGPDSSHPVLKLKDSKILHDNLWGTNRFYWHELAIIDSPLFQRLRDIHQTGLAFHVYMSAHHTRFEHSLGVTAIAPRIFDEIAGRHSDDLKNIVGAVFPDQDFLQILNRLRKELRLAALLHDTGHSILSHTSEQVYGRLKLMKEATEELSDLTGKSKGAGEVISFCFAKTRAIAQLLERSKNHLLNESKADLGEIDFTNVALIIVGRSCHPFLQFLGDIISSGFDADKLDYLFRDALNAGLPLKYDFERYLYSVVLDKNILRDDEDRLKALYSSPGLPGCARKEPNHRYNFPYFDTYRLRLPKKSMNTIEQIVICKLMLFSYIYHHRKVRAAEGMVKRMLERMVANWEQIGLTEESIFRKFLDLTDSALFAPGLGQDSSDSAIEQYRYRTTNRLLPREVYGICGGSYASHAEEPLLKTFLVDLQDSQSGETKIQEMERAIGEELLSIDNNIGQTAEEALVNAGVWFDVPKPPEFHEVTEMVVREHTKSSGVPLTKIFPIKQWTEAYTHFRYHVRIFAFSEYLPQVEQAARRAMERVIKIHGTQFYEVIKRDRMAGH